MKIDDLRKAIGDIDDDLIEEADRFPIPRKSNPLRIRVVAIAAALVVIATLAVVLPLLLRHSDPGTHIPADLELLSFRIVDGGEPLLEKADGEQYLLLAFEEGTSQQTIESVDHGVQKFCATVKNMNRVPFIDLVVYLSWKNTAVVFNEGHGEYQCASTTVFEDGLWVTNIEFDLEPEYDEQFEAKVEILQISFLGSDNSLLNASLSDSNVSGKTQALLYSSDFSLLVDQVRYRIVFENEEIYAVAEERLSDEAGILQTVSFSDHEGSHEVPVKGIGKAFLANSQEVLSLTIPASITVLEEGLFDSCEELEYLSFEGTVEDWTQRFGDLSLPISCLSVYCSNGETTAGEHVPDVLKVSFDPDSMKCVIADRCCSVCGHLLEKGREETLLPMNMLTLLLKSQIPDELFLPAGTLLISPFKNSFDAPLDLSDLFAVSIVFQTDDLNAMLNAVTGQLELSSSGIQDQQEIYWELPGKVFEYCQKISGNKYRMTLIIQDAKYFDPEGQTCDLSKIDFIRMYFDIPDGTTGIKFKVNEISLYTTESVLKQNGHMPVEEDPIQFESHQLVLTDCSEQAGWASGNAVSDANPERDYIQLGPFNSTYAKGQVNATFRLPGSGEQTMSYINADGYRFFCFDLFVSDISRVWGETFTLELSSGDKFGENGIVLTLPIEAFFDYELKNGWNHAVIGMDCVNWTNTDKGLIDLSQLSGFRFFNEERITLRADFLIGFDDLYFWDGLTDGYEYSFQTGHGLDNPYVISSSGHMHTGDFYWNDQNTETVLKFHVEDALNAERVELVMKTGGQLALSVSGDGENWETVFLCTEPSNKDGFRGLTVMSRYFDLTTFVELSISQDVYVKIGDASTEDGFGGRLYDVMFQVGTGTN